MMALTNMSEGRPEPPPTTNPGEKPLVENGAEDRDNDFMTAARWQVAIFGAGLLTAALTISIYALTGPDKGETFSTLVLFGSAACVVGGFFGFLFGVPRSAVAIVARDGQPKGGQGVEVQAPMAAQNVPSVTGLAANTNL